MFKSLFHYYNNLSIANKLKFMGISTMAIVGTIAITFILVYEFTNEKNIIENEIETLANVIADNVASAVLFNDTQHITKTLSSFRYKQKVEHAYAMDNRWNILGTYTRGEADEHEEILQQLRSGKQQIWDGSELYIVVPVHVNDEQVGFLVVIASLNEFIIRIVTETVVIILIVLFSYIMTFRYRARLRDSILMPIAKLNESTNKIIKTETLTENVMIYNYDEIGELAKNFNLMLEKLGLSQKELTDQKDILEYQAYHDALTGLPNRLLFYDRLEQAINKAKRNNEEIAVFFIDLDHFKQINDSLGHEVGDEVLKLFAKCLRNNTREEDTLARMGGDEFMLMMENLQTPQTAVVVALKIIASMCEPIWVAEHELYLTSSTGISLYPQDGSDAQVLIRNADSAMYKAKDEGRNTYQFYTMEMTELAFERMAMEVSLHRALDNGEFVVYYQPQFSGLSEKLLGMEALVRWNHPDIGLVSPDKFIPLSEESGLIVLIDRFVMKTAMTQMTQWYRADYKPGVLAINLAMKQLEQDDFIPTLENLLKETECQPEWLELEITEGHLMKNPDQTILILQKISHLGIHIAIDDFGTGYSSLSYLKRLPINKLKIDQSFVRDIPEDAEDVAIVNAVIALSKSLNLSVIAEGVETHKQKKFLVENGCENIQGYLYSRPIPADEMEKMLTEQRLKDQG